MPRLKTYSDFLKQIEQLRAKADEVRQKEVAGVIARIRQAIAYYDITPDELLPADRSQRAPNRERPAGDPAPKVVRYRDDQGNTWGGRGKRPKWIHDALSAGGFQAAAELCGFIGGPAGGSLEDFSVDRAQAVAAEPAEPSEPSEPVGRRARAPRRSRTETPVG